MDLNRSEVEKVLLDTQRWLSDQDDPFGPDVSPDAFTNNLKYLQTRDDWRVNEAIRWAGALGLAKKQMRVLDAGCGLGIPAIVANMLGCSWAGYDVDGLSLQQARRIAKACGLPESVAESIFLPSDGMSIPFSSDSFNIAVSHQVVEHVPSIYEYLAEIYRTLIPGGILLLHAPEYRFSFEPHYKIPWIPFMRKDLAKLWVQEFGKPEAGLGHFNYVSLQEVNSVAQTIGFSTVAAGFHEDDCEEAIRRQREIIYEDRPLHAIGEDDVPRLANRCKDHMGDFFSRSFYVICQKPTGDQARP